VRLRRAGIGTDNGIGFNAFPYGKYYSGLAHEIWRSYPYMGPSWPHHAYTIPCWHDLAMKGISYVKSQNDKQKHSLD
jgi:hypothetical protein